MLSRFTLAAEWRVDWREGDAEGKQAVWCRSAVPFAQAQKLKALDQEFLFI